MNMAILQKTKKRVLQKAKSYHNSDRTNSVELYNN